MKIWNAINYKVFVAPNKTLINKLCIRKGGRVHPPLLKRFNKNIDLIKKAERDGNINILPLIFHYAKGPQELKSIFGKGKWKALCSKSFGYNYVYAAANCPDNFSYTCPLYSYSFLKDNRFHYIENDLSRNALHCLYKNLRILTKKDLQIPKYFHTISDTIYMSEQLELQQEVKENWSWRKWLEKHNHYSKLIAERDFPSDTFELDEFIVDKYNNGEFSAELLKSPKEVATEAKIMKHCVTSYIPFVHKGSSVLYSIKKYNLPYSTLQIKIKKPSVVAYKTLPSKINKEREFRIGQHYMKFNGNIKDSKADETANLLLKEIYSNQTEFLNENN
jgi:hypothetical protein